MSATIEVQLPQDVLRQRLPGFLSQTLTQLEKVPEFAASPRMPNPEPTEPLPYQWRRDANALRGSARYEITHIFYAYDLQHLSIDRISDNDEQWTSVYLDLQERKAKPGIIAAPLCVIHYDNISIDDWKTNYNSEKAFQNTTFLVAELLQAPA